MPYVTKVIFLHRKYTNFYVVEQALARTGLRIRAFHVQI